jgi:hypothetical protein
VYSPDELAEVPAPKSAADKRDLIAQSIVELRKGLLDPKFANSISSLGAGFLRALEVSDLEQRLAALESQNDGQNDGDTRKQDQALEEGRQKRGGIGRHSEQVKAATLDTYT